MNMEPLMTSVPTKENVLAKITMLETSVTDALKDSLAFPTAKDALAMTKDQKAQSVTPPENVLAKLTSKATVVINASLLSMVSLIAKVHPTRLPEKFNDLNLISFPACQCNAEGSESTDSCDESGKCACKPNIAGDKCDQCAEGFGMNGFPSCLKEVNIKFHVIDALYNKGMAGIEVKAKTAEGEKTKVTDEGGFAPIGPFVPGEAITVDVAKDGYDSVTQVLTANENVDFDMVGLNPTVSTLI